MDFIIKWLASIFALGITVIIVTAIVVFLYYMFSSNVIIASVGLFILLTLYMAISD